MDWPADVRPASLKQPDGVSCGPTTVVAARMLLEPGWRPEDTGAEIARTHRGLTSVRDAAGRLQLPWPRALGSPPWAVARALSRLTGRRIRPRLARHRPASSYDELARRVATRPVAVYLGNRWLPRHVGLAVTDVDSGAAVRVFDPARGQLVTVPRDRWIHHRIDIAGWSHFWAIV